MEKPPVLYPDSPKARPQRPQRRLKAVLGLLGLVCVYSIYTNSSILASHDKHRASRVPLHADESLARCKAIQTAPGAPANFHLRDKSDRYEPGTPPTLIKNGKVWTGGEQGTEVVETDILLDKGIIKGLGFFSQSDLTSLYAGLKVIDAKGAWVTPGIVDTHSHLGDASSPALDGAEDDNSLHGTAQPWLRSLDGLNTHDDSYRLSISGGVTTSLILPGSANAIGGQAFPVKLRKTSERSTTAMLLEPAPQLNRSDASLTSHWRHMKHACGENPSRVYGSTRMDTFWAFRESYNTATQLKRKQDDYCSKALAGDWEGLGEFPEDLRWEALVDVLRGKVKVNVHCYEAVDIDDLIRLSNEFKFPIAAVHHASEAYLVPDVLKRAYGKTPGVALFATNGRYKREAYRTSEFAPRILNSHNISVMMKSDHPVLDSRYLLYEAQQAHYYGLPSNVALASVITTTAEHMGMGHRLGYIKEGYDADIVIWDSHPLALGATPQQVFIDGIAQLEDPHVVQKPRSFQKVPKTPNFDREVKKAVEHEGLPPLDPEESKKLVVFENVAQVYGRSEDQEIVALDMPVGGDGIVVVQDGRIVCAGSSELCISTQLKTVRETIRFLDLEGGSISPGLTRFGPPLGLEEINQEPSTNDGVVLAALSGSIPELLKGSSAVIRAVDGLQFGTRDALVAYRSGVTAAISAPVSYGFVSGLGTAFSTGAAHKLAPGAIIKDITALHVAVSQSSSVSVSTQIAALRGLLLKPADDENGKWFKQVASGTIPLVVEAHSADIIATIISLKKEVEAEMGNTIKLTITGASEAHILADELAEANVGVVVSPSRPFPTTWEDRRILPGPPLTNQTLISILVTSGVTVGIGAVEGWDARNARFDLAWAALNADNRISKEEAIALSATNLEKLLGVEVEPKNADLVATRGGDLLDMQSQIAAIISPSRSVVDLF